MNTGKEKTTQGDVKPWESCLEIPKASLMLTHSETSGPKSGGADGLNMLPWWERSGVNITGFR